jgi:hypothetical protein
LLQKTYWLGQISDEKIEVSQKIRMLYCVHEFPVSQDIQCLPAFTITDGGLVSNTYAWALVINSYSIAIPGFAFVSADEVSEQIRRLLILKLNFLLAKLPADVEKLCDIKNSVGSELVPSQVIPNFFSNERRNLYQTMNGIGSWINAILLLPRDKCSDPK